MHRPTTVDLSYVGDNQVPESWKNMEEDKVLVLFNTPSNIIISSSTMGGKTMFVSRLLEHDMFTVTPEKIMYCYNSRWQDLFSHMESEIDGMDFYQGMPSQEEIDSFLSSTESHKLMVFDDLMTDAVNSDRVMKLFTVGTHHNNCSVILLTHNLFPKSKHSRTLSLNTQTFVVMANTRDLGQLETLGRQLGYKHLLEAYKAATPRPYSYLVIDVNNCTIENLRLRGNIFPDDKGPTEIYKAE